VYFQIKELVLWSRESTHKPRRIPFHLGAVNVITGASKKGKSAVIPIVDYCLGADRCAIPVGVIRNSCSWFGVVVTTSEGDKLLARREPEGQQSTGDMMVIEGEVAVPEVPNKNSNVEATKRMLDRLAGLSGFAFDPENPNAGFKGRPSFRDLVAFTFQPQNIVANPDVLFFKADTFEHREKLRTIFPYVLGALSSDLLAKRWEVDRLERELRRKERELDARVKASERWRAELRAWASEALDLGLATPTEIANARDETSLIALLSTIVARTSRDATVTPETTEASGIERVELDREESDVTAQIMSLRTRFEQMNRLRSSLQDYSTAVDRQRERLSLSRWMRELSNSETICPVCNNAFSDTHNLLDELCDALAETETTAKQVLPAPAAFDREMLQVRDQVRIATERLQGVRIRKRAKDEASTKSREAKSREMAADRFLGRAEQALKVYAGADEDTAARNEVDALKRELAVLRDALSDAKIRDRIAAALQRVTLYIGRVLPLLDVEESDNPVELNIDELTLRVKGKSGRSDFLWEIGSGANWLSYHVATILSLHRLFLEQSENPVPNFIVFDQPSQVYFPRVVARDTNDPDPDWKDEDVQAVRKVFTALSESVKASNGRLQCIVLDHADHKVWGVVEGVKLIAEWRDDDALVPEEWIRK
jgi:hypothetical protein